MYFSVVWFTGLLDLCLGGLCWSFDWRAFFFIVLFYLPSRAFYLVGYVLILFFSKACKYGGVWSFIWVIGVFCFDWDGVNLH